MIQRNRHVYEYQKQIPKNNDKSLILQETKIYQTATYDNENVICSQKKFQIQIPLHLVREYTSINKNNPFLSNISFQCCLICVMKQLSVLTLSYNLTHTIVQSSLTFIILSQYFINSSHDIYFVLIVSPHAR